MNLPKSWLIAAVIIALLYLFFPRYEVHSFRDSSFLYRFDRWTGKAELMSTAATTVEWQWRSIQNP